MLRAEMVGPKILYFNPSMSSKISTANLAAIKTTAGAMDVMSPYAYTATVADEYDTCNFILADAGATLAATSRVAFGLFLTPDNEKGNLLFQVSGKAAFSSVTGTNPLVRGGFFFGRKATNNTVVSSLAAVSNTLAKFQYLPSKFERVSGGASSGTSSGISLHDSIETEIFTLTLSGGYVYCFGYYLENYAASTPDVALHGGVSLQFRKFRSSLDVFNPR